MTTVLDEEQAVARVVRQQVKGMVAQDIASLKQVIAPDARLYHITGTVQSRDEWLKQIKIGRMHYFSSKEVLFQVKVTGDQAEVIARNELDARIYGFRNTWPLQTRTKLAKVTGRWWITTAHSSMY